MVNEIVNNKVNLCDSCSQVYPDCTSKPENVYFGDGIGHDNICACSEYRPSAQPQWIPVTDRLPERGKDVLVTRDYDGRADHIKSCRYVEVASCYGEDDDVSWNSYSDEYKMTPKNHRVVAWMPLPEAYKGEEI